MPQLDNLILYYRGTCPFCQRVLRYMDENDITMEMRDTTQAANIDDLERLGGKRQVPCLIIDGDAMYESADIIEYLKQRTA